MSWFKRNNLHNIYAMHSIDGFAMSLIGIFVPVYLLELGYSLSEVFIYFIQMYFLMVILCFMAMMTASRIGLKYTLILRFPFVFALLIAIYSLNHINLYLPILAFLQAASIAFFWMPLHILFSRSSKEDNIGSSTGKLFAIPQMFSLFGPIVGALIISYFGYVYLFITVFIFLLFSFLPLLYSDSIKINFSFKFKRGLNLFKKYPKFFIAEIFENMGEETGAIIWPIFVFLHLQTIESVGLVGTLVGVGSALFTLFIGKLSDKYNKWKIIKAGAALLFFAWTIRYFMDSEAFVYVISVLTGFFSVLLLVPFTSILYKLPKDKELDEYFAFREIFVGIGRILILSLALLFINDLSITFLFAGAAYLFFFAFKS